MQATQNFSNKSGVTVWLILAISSLLLSACCDLSYKRGANSQDLDKDKMACAASIQSKKAATNTNENETNQAIKQCLEARGWAVQNLAESDMLGSLLLTLLSPSKEASAEVSAEKTNLTPAKKELSGDASSSNKAEPAKSEEANNDPYQVFKINSWWKSGSTAESLKTDINSCVSKLGKAHQPSNSLQQATRGLILYMQEQGWRAWRQSSKN